MVVDLCDIIWKHHVFQHRHLYISQAEDKSNDTVSKNKENHIKMNLWRIYKTTTIETWD